MAKGGKAVAIQCDACGTTVVRYPSAIADGARFCSRKCSSKHKKRTVTITFLRCQQCGKIKVYTKGQERKQFCSRACMYASRKRSTNRPTGHTAEYKRWVRAVTERDRECVRCGRSDIEMHAHHKQPWAFHPELRFDISNGELLCVDCHVLEHPKVGYLLRAHRKPKFPKLCPICNREFMAPKRAQMHCSKKCSGKAKGIKARSIMQCFECGVTFMAKRSKHKGFADFCSKRCMSAWFGRTQGGRTDGKKREERLFSKAG